MVIYSLLVFGGLIFAIWSVGYLVARGIEALLDD
jgi:glucose dehydrogenase